LSEAVSLYTADAAERMRHEKLSAGAVTVFVDTGQFRKKCPYYCNSASCAILPPTSATGELIKHSLHLLKKIFRGNLIYKKAGVVFTELIPTGAEQLGLFDANPANFAKSCMLSETLDSINSRFGDGSIFYASEGVTKRWTMIRERCSPHYTTRWSELPDAG